MIPLYQNEIAHQQIKEGESAPQQSLRDPGKLTMNTTQSNTTPLERALAQSCQIRPCSYDPTENYEPVADEFGVRKILSLPYKLLWFHTYCSEKGLEGHVEADDFSIVAYEPSGTSDPIGTAIVTARAKVYINGKVVATASAGKSFIIGNTSMMDGAIQAASGSALSRALGNAGFGCISATDTDSPAPTQPVPLPFTMTGTAPSAPASVPMTPDALTPRQTSNPPAAPSPDIDPVAAAKAVVWSGNGIYKGKSLGELLATSPNQIIWIAENWNGSGPIKDAALALLPEAKKRCGK